MKNLTAEITKIYSAKSFPDKKAAAIELISTSHAKSETKKLALLNIECAKSPAQIDKFMTNYMLSGEGMKV